jgi:hypothetical protein
MNASEVERLVEEATSASQPPAEAPTMSEGTHNRLLCAQETLRHALNVLAAAAPQWLSANNQAAWPRRPR